MTAMSDLSPRARQMLQSSVKRATAADRDRIQDALRGKLGLTTLSVAERGGAPPARARWPYFSSAIVGVGLIGGALLFMTRHKPADVVPVVPAVASVVATAPSAPVATPAESGALAPPPAAVVPELAAPSARPAPDRLAQELAFLERATSALHAGRASSALKILDEYQRKFPNGLLALERSAARAQALCSLGRRSEAQTELSRLPAQSPGVARAKQVCDASSNAGP
jgi:hypothetical protein